MDNGLLKHGEQLAINPLLWPGRGRNSNSHSHDKGTWLLDPSAYDHTLAVALEAHPTLGQSDGHAVYAIKEVRVLSSAARAVVQDCGEAEQNSDARDKFFM